MGRLQGKTKKNAIGPSVGCPSLRPHPHVSVSTCTCLCLSVPVHPSLPISVSGSLSVYTTVCVSVCGLSFRLFLCPPLFLRVVLCVFLLRLPFLFCPLRAFLVQSRVRATLSFPTRPRRASVSLALTPRPLPAVPAQWGRARIEARAVPRGTGAPCWPGAPRPEPGPRPGPGPTPPQPRPPPPPPPDGPGVSPGRRRKYSAAPTTGPGATRGR